MTVTDVIALIPRKYHTNVENYPALVHIWNMLKVGRPEKAYEFYNSYQNSRTLFLTHKQFRKARRRRINLRNRRVYGTNWSGFVRKKKPDLYYIQKGLCNICKKHFYLEQLQIDHIIPLRDNGSVRNIMNLQLLCRPCHIKKDFVVESRSEEDKTQKSWKAEDFGYTEEDMGPLQEDHPC